jgi:hypothetical protein
MMKEMTLAESNLVLGGYCSPIMLPVTNVQRIGSLLPQTSSTRSGLKDLNSAYPLINPIHSPTLPICPDRFK